MIARTESSEQQAPQEQIARLVREALASRDARFVERVLADISECKGLQREKRASALQAVLANHKGLNSVAIEGLHRLHVLSPESSKALARSLLMEPANEDRDNVHGSAIIHLIDSKNLEHQDFELIASSMSHQFPAVRMACQRSLRGLEDKRRKAIIAALKDTHSDATKPLRIFLETVPSSAPVPEVKGQRGAPEKILSAERKKAASEIAAARFEKARQLQKKARELTAASLSSMARHTEELPGQEIKDRPQELKPAETLVFPQVVTVAEVVLTGEALMVFNSRRRVELRDLGLEALQRGATLQTASADEILAHLSEIAVRFGPTTAADSMGRLVYFISDPHLAEKGALSSFVSTLLGEATRF